jgi:hypothetical protein
MQSLLSVMTQEVKSDKLRNVLAPVFTFLHGKTAKYGSVIRESPLGDAIYRGIVAVDYDDSLFLFYSLDFRHIAGGWEMVNVDMSTNLNEILAKPWPFK